MLVIGQNRSIEEGQLLIQNAPIAAAPHILRHRKGQPRAVIGNARPHAIAFLGQPLVLNIALHKLTRCRTQQMLTD